MVLYDFFSIFGVVIYIIFAAAVLAFCIPLFLCGAPFVPVHKNRIEDMMRVAHITIQDRVVDIGSGDGRFVIESAKRGARAVGYELNPFLVLWSRFRIRRAGLQDLAKITWANIWTTNFAGFTVVMLFGFPNMMAKLEKKLKYELPKGARVVSFAFKFPTWILKSAEKGVYLYIND